MVSNHGDNLSFLGRKCHVISVPPSSSSLFAFKTPVSLVFLLILAGILLLFHVVFSSRVRSIVHPQFYLMTTLFCTSYIMARRVDFPPSSFISISTWDHFVFSLLLVSSSSSPSFLEKVFYSLLFSIFLSFFPSSQPCCTSILVLWFSTEHITNSAVLHFSPISWIVYAIKIRSTKS